MKRIIEVLPYQMDWPRLFKHEASLLQSIFGRNVVSIHHIGSTSVPDLKAKPTIDILINRNGASLRKLINDNCLSVIRAG